MARETRSVIESVFVSIRAVCTTVDGADLLDIHIQGNAQGSGEWRGEAVRTVAARKKSTCNLLAISTRVYCGSPALNLSETELTQWRSSCEAQQRHGHATGAPRACGASPRPARISAAWQQRRTRLEHVAEVPVALGADNLHAVPVRVWLARHGVGNAVEEGLRNCRRAHRRCRRTGQPQPLSNLWLLVTAEGE